jgi:prepilin-type N-terminal cleavage/methylation domain-containing protein
MGNNPRPKISNYKSAGFTLIEFLVVMALVGVVASFALVISMDSYHSNNFSSEQNQLLGALLKARSQAVANINQKPHGVHLDHDTVTYTVFQGSSFSGRPASDTSLDIVFSGNPAYALSGSTDVIFTQLTGATTVATISLDDHTNPIFNICTNSEGQINVKAICP